MPSIRFSQKKLIQPLLPEQIGPRYLVAGLSLLAATALKFGHSALVGPDASINTPFITYYLAVIIAAWFSGFVPGLLSVVVSLLLSNYFFIEPYHHVEITSFASGVNLALFGGAGILICWVGRELHRALGEAREELAESKALAGKLEVERNRFVVTLSSIGDAVLATDVNGRVNFMNPIAVALTGWSFEEAANKPVAEVFRIISEDDRQKAQNPISRVLTEGIVVGLANHTLLICKDGREIPIDDSGAPIRDETGQIIGAVLAFRDVSERRRWETAQDFLVKTGQVLASSLDYEVTLQNVANLVVPEIAEWCTIHIPERGEIKPVALAHADPAKVALALEWRERYPLDSTATTGVPQVLRSGVPEFVPVIPKELIDLSKLNSEQVALLQELDFSSYIIVPMLSRGEVRGAITFVRNSRQAPYDREDLALALEMARRAAMAVDNARLYREAQRSIELRNDFLSIAAHELKTPITSLKGYNQLLLRQLETTGELDPVRVRRTLQVLDEQSNKLSQLVTQLLDVSRLESRKFQLDCQPTDLVEFLQNLVETNQLALSSNTRHPLQLTIQPGYSVLVVPVDVLRLEQVLTNLINNAVKFSPAGGVISISLEVENNEKSEESASDCAVPATSKTGYAIIKVTDQGIGVPELSRPHLFERFYQAHTAEGVYTTGMGLGLYISQEIILLHRGTITAEFPPEGGTRFVVKLPLAKKDSLATPD